MDASYKIQRGIHVHLIQFFMCPEFWVHITLQRSCFEIYILARRDRICYNITNLHEWQEILVYYI